jgi:hypothetical protein
MRNEFDLKLKEFKTTFLTTKESKSIFELKENYSNLEAIREEIFFWLMNMECDDEQRSEYLTEFAMFEHNLWVDPKTRTLIGAMPIFDDDIYFEDIEKMFDEYGSYFQRFGCLRPDQVLSWDQQNVLFMDEFSNVEIVKRPDILMNI